MMQLKQRVVDAMSDEVVQIFMVASVSSVGTAAIVILASAVLLTRF